MNTKALSPVVAAIILIAITVAASIAVAAWMDLITNRWNLFGDEVETFNGTVTDMQHKQNWLLWLHTSNSYKIVVVNDTTEWRFTVNANQIEQQVFGKLGKTQTINIGDNVTVTKTAYGFYNITKQEPNQ